MFIASNQITLLVYEAVTTTINDQMGWRHFGVSFLRGSMGAEGMGCEMRGIRWVLR